MKKLNITKEQFNRSKYFKNKYGTLEYVSESGKIFKTDKGKVLMFKESDDEKFIQRLLKALYQAEFGRDYIIDLESKDTISILDREGNGYMLNISTVDKSFAVNEAIPKTLKEIPQEQAERLIQKHLRAGTGEWEDSPGFSDFIYEIGGGRYKLIRPGFGGRYETGIVSL